MARWVASAAFIGRRGELRALRAALSRAADGDDLVNVEHNTTTEGPFWNVGTWGFATS
jgi:hypothetical protein